MKQSSTNENVVIGNNETIETCMNDEIMEENVGVQTKTSKNPKNENKSSKLACTKKKVRNHMEDYLCVGIFIVSIIMQKLTLSIHKSHIVSFDIKNL